MIEETVDKNPSTEEEKKRRDEEEDDHVDEGDGEGYREEGKEEGDAVAMDEEFDPETGKALKRRVKIAGVKYRSCLTTTSPRRANKQHLDKLVRHSKSAGS